MGELWLIDDIVPATTQGGCLNEFNQVTSFCLRSLASQQTQGCIMII
jgi:hypothetical protein